MTAGYDCEKMLESISDYVDGSLRQSLCAELEKHLEGCPNCRVVVDTLRKTIELYHQPLETTAEAPELRERLFARLHLSDQLPKGSDDEHQRICPDCGSATLVRDGMLNLICETCGWCESGAHT